MYRFESTSKSIAIPIITEKQRQHIIIKLKWQWKYILWNVFNFQGGALFWLCYKF